MNVVLLVCIRLMNVVLIMTLRSMNVVLMVSIRLMNGVLITIRKCSPTAHEGGGCDQSIGSTVSVRSWLWSTTTSSPLCYFSNYCK